MLKATKVYTKKNPIDILLQETEIEFEFVGDYEYKILIDIVTQRAKITMPNGTILDDEFEYYFLEDEQFKEHDEFYEWLKFLLMSFEFYGSDIWQSKHFSS